MLACMQYIFRASIVVSLLCLVNGCNPESTFAAGRDLDPCLANIPTGCGISARCVLDSDHYLAGTLPGSRQFLVRAPGEVDATFRVLLDERRSSGTAFVLTAHEPTCSAVSVYDNMGQDVFALTDSDGVLVVVLHLRSAGDHLVELTSDANSHYALMVDL
jgi:hypothetical protein